MNMQLMAVVGADWTLHIASRKAVANEYQHTGVDFESYSNIMFNIK